MTIYKMRTTPIKRWEGETVRTVAIVGFVAAIIGAFFTGQFLDATFQAAGGAAAVFFLLGVIALITAFAGLLVALVVPLIWFVN